MTPDSGVEGMDRSSEALRAENRELRERLREAERRYEEEREHSESLLYEQNRFQTLIESMADEVWICDADGELTWINSAALEGVGFKTREEVYQPVEKLAGKLEILESDGTPRSADVAPLLRSVRYGEVVRHKDELVRNLQTGETRFRRVSSSPIRDIDGTILGAVAIVRDVTGLVRTEHALATGEARFRAMFEHAPEGIIVTDEEGRIIMANPVAEKLCGRPIPYGLSYPSHRFLRIHHADGMPCDPRRFPLGRAVFDGETTSGEEYTIDRPDGEIINILVSCAPILDGQGRRRGAVLLFHDITSMVETRAILHRRYQEYRALVENNSDIIARFDRDHRFVFMNPAVMKSTGHSADYFTGKTIDEIGLPPPEQEGIAAVLRDVFSTGKEISRELVFNTVDGEKTYLIRFSPEFSHEGNVASVLGIWREITDFKQLERQLITAKESAEEANRAKSDFLAHMSHEIRTPIGGIIGLTDLLLSRTTDPDKLRFVGLIRESAHSLLDLINDILDLSKIESGKMEVLPQNFNLLREISRLEGPFSLIARKKGLSFSLQIADDIPPAVRGDAKLIRQVLTNLLSNAVKYTEEGGVTLSIRRDTPESGTLVFTVSDTGTGIPLEKQHLLFQSFRQLDITPTKAHEGTGLGLAISKRLARLMNGDLTVESEAGKGSSFSLVIPLESARGEPTAERQCIAGNRLAELGSLRILVVEDNPINRLFVEVKLQESGHTVVLKENGREAVDALRSEAFDVVLMDVQMPVMDGIEATRIIRQFEDDRAKVPIVALTAFAMKGDAERFFDGGMNGYVTKPIDFDELADELSRVLRRSSVS